MNNNYLGIIRYSPKRFLILRRIFFY